MTQCLKPIHLKIDDSGRERIVPCGKCNACLVRQRMEWAVRLQYEERKSHSSFFVTLTYDNEHLPVQEFVEPDTGAVFYNGVVDKRDVQLFMKRLRKSLDIKNIKLRYYLISEYGPQTFRPHYHGLFFLDSVVSVVDFHRACVSAWPYCSPERLTVDFVTVERIRYCTEYCLTKNGIPTYLTPNFRLMSRNPGIGAAYVDLMKGWHLADESRFFSPGFDGRNVNMPRYYREKIYSKDIREQHSEDLSEQRLKEKIDLVNSPGFDREKYEADLKAKFADYNRKTEFLLTKKLKKI